MPARRDSGDSFPRTPRHESRSQGFRLNVLRKWPILLGLVVASTSAASKVSPGRCVESQGGFALREKPGGRWIGSASGGPSLVLDCKVGKGGQWVRLIGQNGEVGWSRLPKASRVSEARFDSAQITARRESPDADSGEYDPPVVSDQHPDTTLVEIGAVQRILRSTRFMGQRGFPPNLPDRIFQYPWVEVEGTKRRGWIPATAIPFHCGNDSSGLRRPPFFRPESMEVSEIHRATAWSWDGWSDSLVWEPNFDTTLQLVDPQWKVTPPANSKSDLVSITGLGLRKKGVRAESHAPYSEGCLYSGTREGSVESCTGPVEAWKIQRLDGEIDLITGYAPEIVNARFQDLDDDGKIEWILEISTHYGDGTFDHLMILDGRQPEDSLNLASVKIGGSSGEPSASEAVESTWSVLTTSAGPRLKVVSKEGRKTTSAVYSYKHGKLTKVGK